MPQEVLTAIRVQGPNGPADLRLERTRIIRQSGRKGHENTEAVPLDMVDAVSYGEAPRNLLWGALGLFAFLVFGALGYLLFLQDRIYLAGTAGFGLLLLLAGILVSWKSGGRRLQIRSDATHWRFTYPRQQTFEVSAFLERLMMVRLAFLEGVYSDEADPPAPKGPSAATPPSPDEEE